MIVALVLVPVLPLSDLLAFSEVEWRKTPKMAIEDAYKWLFHATLGGEHAISDDSGPRAWMNREWETLTAAEKYEQEMTPLTPDGRLIRVNLRPYRERGGEAERLLAVFIESAKRFKGEKQEFFTEWIGLGELLKRRKVGHITRADWTRLDARLNPLGYPAVHHSEVYEKMYRPAYRVVLADLLAQRRQPSR